jgi:HAD superfamily hydrolase (TIGR01509 family)
MKKNTKALIFDIFGVLCDSYNGKWQEENLADKPNLHREFQELSDLVDLGKKFQSDYYRAAARVVNKNPKEVQREMERGFTINTRLFTIVTELRKKYNVAICSNSGAKFAREIFLRHGYRLEEYFDYVGISSEIGLLKPGPSIFKYCAKKLDLEPRECLFVDDREENIIGAKKVGMQTCLFTNQDEFEAWLAVGLN